MTNYWFFDWLEEHHLASRADVARAIQSPDMFRSLQDHAAEDDAYAAHDLPGENGHGLVAAAGIDLSGNLDCKHAECLIKQVDQLFRRTWHYFDYIVVDDLWGHLISDHWDGHPEGDRLEQFLHHAELAVWLRHVGLDQFLRFRRKRPVIASGPSQAIERYGLRAVEADLDDLREEVAAHSTVSFQDRGGDSELVRWRLEHPSIEPSPSGMVRRGALDDAYDKEGLIVDDVVQRAFHHLIADVALSSRLELPLGASVWLQREMLRGSGKRRRTAGDVAYELELPVVQGATAEDLIRLRSEHGDSFISFRGALRKAMQERLRAGTEDPSRIAREIKSDLIEPELARIRLQLESSKRLFERVGTRDVLVSTLLTVTGVITGNPLLYGPGIALGASGVRSAYTDRDKAHEAVRNSDMYFLWEASQREH